MARAKGERPADAARLSMRRRDEFGRGESERAREDFCSIYRIPAYRNSQPTVIQSTVTPRLP